MAITEVAVIKQQNFQLYKHSVLNRYFKNIQRELWCYFSIKRHFFIFIQTELIYPIFPINGEVVEEVREQRGQLQWKILFPCQPKFYLNYLYSTQFLMTFIIY